MKRDFEDLGRGPFDLLVIGGGIYGAWTAWDAALRGMSVALVDQGDWASATSARSSKLIHGGLRYLERLELGLVRKALRERKRLAANGPHRIRPLRFVLPVYRGGRVGRTRLRLGLWLYDRLAGGGQPVAGHRGHSRAALLGAYPWLAPEGLKGGFSYGDCATDDHRMALEIVAGAQAAGTATVNYARATRLLRDAERVAGAEIEDVETGRRLELRAACTVAAAGPWVGELAREGAPERAAGRLRLTKGVHLVLPALPSATGSEDEAFLLTARSDGRVFFLIPWYGRTLLGTTDTDYRGDPGAVAVEEADVDYLLTAARRFFAGAAWTRDDVLGSFAGLRAMQGEEDKPPSAVSREWALREPAAGLLISVGGKYTSAREDAARVVDAVQRRLGRPVTECATESAPFPWRPEGDFAHWLEEASARGREAGLDPEAAEAAAHRYGTRLPELLAILAEDRAQATRLHPALPFCRGEVAHAARHEMARTLADVLRRRIPLQILGLPQREVLDEAARTVGSILDWPAAQRDNEVEHLISATR